MAVTGWVLYWLSSTGKERYFQGFDDHGGILSTREPQDAFRWHSAPAAYAYADQIRLLQDWRVGRR